MNGYLPGLESEQRSRELSMWFTPKELAFSIVCWALDAYPYIQWKDLRCLEPSAGRGALAIPLRERVESVVCAELDADNVDYLVCQQHFQTMRGDFLDFDPRYGGGFDLAVMNPPFEGGQTERHIMHALQLAKRVVCHCPLTTLAGQARRESLWMEVNLHRLAICSTRPKYGADGGKTDMCTIDVTLDTERQDDVKVEWWP